jgi:hypothetical protein
LHAWARTFDLVSAEYGWSMDQFLDLTLPQVLRCRKSIFSRRRADHERQASLLEAAVKHVVANVHAAAGSKHGSDAAGKVNFLQQKKVGPANTEKIVQAFGGQKPLFSEEEMREIRRGRGQRG